MTWSQQGISLLVTFVLAALLGPEQFGLVSMAMVYIGFLQMLLEQGFGAAIVQRKTLLPAHLDTAFWLILAASLSLLLVSVLLSDAWAALNTLPHLSLVIQALSVCIPLQGLTVVQQALLCRSMNFRALALRSFVSTALGGGVGVTMAVYGYGVWALVAQQITTSAVSVGTLWTVERWRPGFACSLAACKDLLGFSVTVFAVNVGTFLNNRIDALVIGMLFGPLPVGIYRLADRLVSTLIELTMRPFHSVSLPAFSAVQENKDQLARTVLNLVKGGTALAIPTMAALVVLADRLPIILGGEWQPAVGALRILSIIGVIKASTIFLGPLLLALGRPRGLLLLTWGVTIVSGVSFALAGTVLKEASVSVQVAGLAASRVVTFGVFWVAATAIGLHLTRLMSFRPIGAVAGRALAVGAAVVLLGGVFPYLLGLDDSMPGLGAAVRIAAIGAGAASLLLLYPEFGFYLRRTAKSL